MAIVPLPPPPTYNMNFEDYEWMEWFRLVHVRVNEAGQFIFDQIDGQISWDQVDTTGSSLTDIQSRSHSDLSDLDYDNAGHTGFARLTGDETQTFLVDEATDDNHAVPLFQVQDIASGGGSASLTVSDDGTEVSTDVGEINFGFDLSVTDDGSGVVTVDASGGGGSSGPDVVEDFSDGTTGSWSSVGGHNLQVVSDRSFRGDNSLYFGDQGVSNDTVMAESFPSDLSGGVQISQYTIHYNESSSNQGSSFYLIDSSGNTVIGAGTDNPEFLIADSNDPTSDNNEVASINYDVWTRIDFIFYWSDGEVDIIFTGLQDGEGAYRYYKRPMINITDIEGIQVVVTNIGGSASDFDFWWDQIEIYL